MLGRSKGGIDLVRAIHEKLESCMPVNPTLDLIVGARVQQDAELVGLKRDQPRKAGKMILDAIANPRFPVIRKT